MTHEPISLHSIDFSQPDGEFTFRGQCYHYKQYLKAIFFRKLFCKNTDFIYSLSYLSLVEEINQYPEHIERCVQYKDTIFCFGIYNRGSYFSLKHEGWISFNWKAPKHISLDELLEKPYEFFVEKARIAYNRDLPFTENEEVDDYSYRRETAKPLEFICGSESELKRLAQLAAVTLAELQPLFEQHTGFTVKYKSENDYHFGGVAEIDPEDWQEVILSKQAQQLFDLIFEYNFFTGLCWEYNDGHGYTGFDPDPYIIEVEVQAPSQHERLEAALELQSWLEGKLPEEEINAYFEG